MIDTRARELYDQRDFSKLFQYIEPMWMVVILQILDDLCDNKGFIPNPNNYQLRGIGIFAERLEVAMAAVLHKHGRTITWGKYWEVYRDKLSLLPPQQQRELHDYWFAGPKPGLAGPGDAPPPIIGQAGDWFVTDLSGTTISVVVTAGFTQITGNITFTRADGTRYSNAIGVLGPSVGVSIMPNVAKIPGFAKLAERFPAIAQLVVPEATAEVAPLNNALLNWLMSSGNPVARVLWRSPVMELFNAMKTVVANESVGPTTLPSAAIGLVAANRRTLQKTDFSGACAMVGFTGTAAVAGFGVYFLAFGLSRWWNPVTDPLFDTAKGYALISAASVSAQIPSLGAAATLFWGEIL
jgi:hypothetical protein